MAYADSTLSQILPLIVARLRTQLTLIPANCHIGDGDDDPKPNPSTVHYVVYLDGSSFSDALWAGGGREQLTADAIVAVKIHSRVMLDQPGHETQRNTHATLGLLPAIHGVLEALAGWEIVDGSGNPLVREVMQPLDITGPKRRDKDHSFAVVRFGCLVDWALT